MFGCVGMLSSEDFSFPKISNPLPQFAVSPTLWRVSSVVYPDDDDDETEVVKEEKMDLLWENFNEEIQRVSSPSSSSSANKKHEQQLCCTLQAFKIPRSNVFQPTIKQSLAFVVKFFKKIFLLHKSTRVKKE